MASRRPFILTLCGISVAACTAPSKDPRGSADPAPETPVFGTIPTSFEDSVPSETGPGLRSDRVLVMLHPGEEADVIAADHGTTLMAEPGRSGFAAFAVPETVDPQTLLNELLDDPRVSCSYRESFFTAASSDPVRWHLDAAGVPPLGETRLDGVVVAIIDSGLAGMENGGWAPRASSLLQSRVHSPWDFVEGDAWPQDEHAHGTHIASLVGGAGPAYGGAPGVGIMPLRVLDAANQGTELDLIEALYWATEHGADVINLSLSFWPDYLPSPALEFALEQAADAGVILVGASGNHGLDVVTWPAASPRVLAVGATCPDGSGGQALAAYSNIGQGVDLVAPGGCLEADADGDGTLDGLVGEIPLQDGVGGTGLALWSGTSQAAAVTSGAIARLLAEGVGPADIPSALQLGAAPGVLGGDRLTDLLGGAGAGLLQTDAALLSANTTDSPTFRAALLPYFRRETGLSGVGADLRPEARVNVVGPDGTPVRGLIVRAELVDEARVVEQVQCTTDTTGACTLSATTLVSEAALQVIVVGLTDSRTGLSQRPGTFVMARDGLEILAQSLAGAGTSGELLAWIWPAGLDPELGELGAAWAFIDLRAGLSRAPSAILATEGRVATMGVRADLSLALEGVALDQGEVDAEVLTLSGSGLATSPLGLLSLPVLGLAVRAPGMDSAGLNPLDFHTMDGSGLATSPLGYEAGPVDLKSATGMGFVLGSPALQQRLDQGGFITTNSWSTSGALPAAGLGPSGEVRVVSSGSAGMTPIP